MNCSSEKSPSGIFGDNNRIKDHLKSPCPAPPPAFGGGTRHNFLAKIRVGKAVFFLLLRPHLGETWHAWREYGLGRRGCRLCLMKFPLFFRPLILISLLGILPAGPAEAQIPSQFDLRDVAGQNYVTGVRSQSGGTCWTHGAMAAMEGNLMITGEWSAAGESGEADLAEYHLDWWNGFNDHNNDDIDPPSGSGLEVHQGGDYRVTAAYLSRGEGAVRDIDAPSYDVAPDRWKTSYHQFAPRDIEWLTAGDDLSSINTIKEALMNNGVVGTCMDYNESFMDGNFVFYQPASSTEDPNHAVAIVGWDDTKAVSGAPGPGAWIVKNSWGSAWGLDGYFWISYWDKHCGKHPEMGAVSFRGVAPPDWDHVYYHDYHGWRDTWMDGNHGLSAFVAQGDESLEKVGFFTTADDVDVTIRVWSSFSQNVPSGLLSSETISELHTGYHLLDLSTPVAVSPGDHFYIEMEVSAGGLAYDRTSEVPVLLGATSRTIVESSASPGESFVDAGSDFVDFTTVETTANLCIKALTSDRGLRVRELGDFRVAGPVGGPFDPQTTSYTIESHEAQTISYEVLCSDSESSWPALGGPLSGTLEPGQTAEITVSVSSGATSFGAGAHLAEISFINSSDHAGDTTRRGLLMVGEAVPVFSETLDNDPGWTTEGQWAWGVPQGLGGDHGFPDPTAGATGSTVYGYNLAGDYPNSLTPQSLTTTSIDCRNHFGIHLRFERWLGVEQPQYDHASIDISTDGSTWMNAWRNGAEVDDGEWVDVDLDISELADNAASLQIRWTMGETDVGWTYCGWNIDDVEITGFEADRAAIFSDSFENGNTSGWSWARE